MPLLDPKDFFNLYAMWGVDLINHLSSISGYAEMLLQNQSGNLTDQQKHFLEVIRKNSLRALTEWHHTNNYLACSILNALPCHKVNVFATIQRAIEYVGKYAQIENIKAQIPDHLPFVQGNDRLERAIAYVLDPQPPGNDFLGYLEGYQPTIEAFLPNDGYVNFQSTSGLRISPEYIKQPADLFYPGTRLSAAKLIIQQCGGEIELIKMEPNLEFRFTLPVWVEAEQ